MGKKISRRFSSGFSLVELVLVVAISALLTMIAAVNYQKYVTHAKYNHAKSDLTEIAELIEGYRVTQNQTLIKILAPASSVPPGAVYIDMGCVPGAKTPICSNPSAGLPAWNLFGYDKIPLDPWGNYYILDQNEGELGPNDCRRDVIQTAGQDQIWNGNGQGDSNFPDDLIFRVPYYFISCPNWPNNQMLEGGL